MKVKSLFLLAAVAVLSMGAVVAQAAGVDVTAFLTPDVAMGLSAVGAAGITTYVQSGDVLDLTPSADVASGEGYLFGAALFGVAVDDVASGAEGRFITEGVVTIGKTSALAISVGDRLYWDATNSVVNKTATAQQHVGIAVEAAANPSSTVKMKLRTNVAAAA